MTEIMAYRVGVVIGVIIICIIMFIHSRWFI